MRDAKLEPEYVYEENSPEVDEIQCPEEQYLSCCEWMDRGELLKHYHMIHPEYHNTDAGDVEVHFEDERTRRYGR